VKELFISAQPIDLSKTQWSKQFGKENHTKFHQFVSHTEQISRRELPSASNKSQRNGFKDKAAGEISKISRTAIFKEFRLNNESSI
jgi:hypothetical protein